MDFGLGVQLVCGLSNHLDCRATGPTHGCKDDNRDMSLVGKRSRSVPRNRLSPPHDAV